MLELSRHLKGYLIALRWVVLLLVARDLYGSPEIFQYTMYKAQHMQMPTAATPLPPLMWAGVLIGWGAVASLLGTAVGGAGRAAGVAVIDLVLASATVLTQKTLCGGLLFTLPVLGAFEISLGAGWGLTVFALVLYPSLVLLQVRSVAAAMQPLVLGNLGTLVVAAVGGSVIDSLRRTETQARALVSVIETSQQLGTSSSIDKVLSLVSADTQALFDVHHCVVYLRDLENPNEPVLRAAQRATAHPEAFTDFNPELVHSILGTVIKEMKGQLVEDFAGYGPEEVIRREAGVRSCMVAPLIFEKEAIGAFFVGHSNSAVYSDQLFRLFTLLCNQVALAVRNVQLQATTATLAITDSLSGLYTHGYFQEHLGKQLLEAKYTSGSVSLMIIDVDFFKKVNDSYGHPQGDALLKQLGGVIKQVTRAGDIICRYGGDEFTVTMLNTNRIGAVVLAERIRQAVEDYEFVLGNKTVHVTVSGGVASFPEDAQTKKELIEKADQAMYESKHKGRNRVSFSA